LRGAGLAARTSCGRIAEPVLFPLLWYALPTGFGYNAKHGVVSRAPASANVRRPHSSMRAADCT
jgi:hypothetical protein